LADCDLELLYLGATEGDLFCARLLLEEIAVSLSSGKPLPEPIMRYLVEALMQGVTGESVDEALNLKKRPGRQIGVDRSWSAIVMAEIELIRRQNETLTNAFELVASKYPGRYANAETVEKAYRRNADGLDYFQSLDEDHLRSLISASIKLLGGI
jgi:hypothetical protein